MSVEFPAKKGDKCAITPVPIKSDGVRYQGEIATFVYDKSIKSGVKRERKIIGCNTVITVKSYLSFDITRFRKRRERNEIDELYDSWKPQSNYSRLECRFDVNRRKSEEARNTWFL